MSNIIAAEAAVTRTILAQSARKRALARKLHESCNTVHAQMIDWLCGHIRTAANGGERQVSFTAIELERDAPMSWSIAIQNDMEILGFAVEEHRSWWRIRW